MLLSRVPLIEAVVAYTHTNIEDSDTCSIGINQQSNQVNRFDTLAICDRSMRPTYPRNWLMQTADRYRSPYPFKWEVLMLNNALEIAFLDENAFYFRIKHKRYNFCISQKREDKEETYIFKRIQQVQVTHNHCFEINLICRRHSYIIERVCLFCLNTTF